ncbi:MAG: hypothetical protein QOH90_1441 [Actinomycetota bacterium]|nr:hypothetical protein [Actinomycetota bacterium]
MSSVEGRPLDDRELIEQAREGDVHAYEVLVARYQGIAFRTAYVCSGSANDAEDAAQEAFVKAYRSLSRFRSDAPFRPWLLKIVANEARNKRRAEGRRHDLALRIAQVGPSGDAAPSPEATALAAERRRRLLAAVNRLPQRDREVLAYRFFLNLSETEMASLMGCRRGTVKSRLSRALDRLRRLVGEDETLVSGKGAAL